MHLVDMSDERNPSPPREFEDQAEKFRQDVIGNTTISKKWVYTVLMEACTEANRQRENEESDIADISEDLQDDLCRLWDLCIEEDVADFLAGIDATEILSGILTASNSPRLTEIVVGILGNMACTEVACETLTKCPEALLAIVSLFSCRDSATIRELGRLVTTCLSTPSCQSTWLDFLESNISNLKEDLIFILSSNINDLVLKYVLEVIDICMDARDTILLSFAERTLSNTIADAGLQLLHSGSTDSSFVTPLHILYLITTVQDPDGDIFSQTESIFEFVAECFKIWAELDNFSISEDNPSAIPLASCMTVYHEILKSLLPSEYKGDGFFDTITQSQKQHIKTLTKATIKYCESNSKIEPVSETVKSKTQSVNDESSTNDNTVLIHITNDLVSVISELKW